MKRLTVSLESEQVDRLDEIQAEHDVDSRSAALRRLFQMYERKQAEYEELNTEYEELQTEVERARRERRQLLEQREEHQELAKYVEDERTAEQRWRQASLTTRLRWRLTGMPSDDEDI
jgi:metal-responsive CopG/Arc/MetJ family transcriptional regulator